MCEKKSDLSFWGPVGAVIAAISFHQIHKSEFVFSLNAEKDGLEW